MHSGTTVARAPGALPGVGHLAAFLRAPLAFLRGLPAHGPLVEILFGRQRVVVVCDPGLTRRMLVQDRIFDKGGPLYERLREAGGQGLASCPAHEHRRQRRLIQPAFQQSRLPGHARVMSERMDALVPALGNGRTVDLTVETRKIAADMVISAIFGTGLDQAVHQRLAEDFHTLLAGFTRYSLTPAPLRKVPLPAYVRYQEATRRVRRKMADLTTEYRARGTGGERNLLSMLIEARAPESDQPALSDDELVDQAVTMYSAGTETTASAVCWALVLAARHPDVQRRLRDEIGTVLGGRTPGWEDVPRLVYTRQVFNEALRMYPPGWFLTRTVEADTTLGPYALSKGATVAFSPYLTSHLPTLYRNPEVFDPDRWTPGERGPEIPTGVFGGGARKCIGDGFALVEGVLLISALLSHWDIELHPDGLAAPRLPQLTLNPGRVRATLRARGSGATAAAGTARTARPS
ncbi:cytochrome P450 [Streptomyces sp. enrichment culture]|uniref:cytochrome P450 n=1 Tax=Streptomyces sp. enrichment culture TaxID=1795815 RepID=UPI003F552D2E